MDISKFFNSSSKKRDLSNYSCNGEKSKKVRERSVNDNCMTNIDAKIKEIWKMNQVTQDNQIKDKCQLRDLAKSIEFYNKKFDKLERDNRKKEEKIN